MMRRWFILAALGWSVSAGGSIAQVIKLGTVVPEGSPWHDTLLDISHQWKEISNGKVLVRIYAGGVAGDEPDMLRKMRIGQLNAAALTSVGLISVVPDIEALTFPMEVRTDDEMDFVLDQVGPTIERQLEQKGYKVLTWSTAGWVQFFSKRKVVTPQDLRQHKLFFWGSDTVYTALLKDLGFTPVSLSVTDLLPSLQTGVVDAFAAPPAAALSFQWFGLTGHMSDLHWQPMISVTVISMKTWNGIPADLRPELERVAREAGKTLRRRSRELEVDAIEAMKAHGLTVNHVPRAIEEEFRALIEQKAKPIFVGERFSKDVYGEVQRALTAYRSGEAARPDASDP